MNKLKILSTAEIDYEIFKALEDLADIQYEGWYKDSEILTEEQMINLIKGKDVLITSYDPVTKAVINASENLKLIFCTRANPVNIDVNYAREKGITVCYTPGRNSDCTAEFTVALMLSITRKIPNAHLDLHNGKFTNQSSVTNQIKEGLKRDITWSLGKNTPYVEYKGMQLNGHSLGLIGYGSIGRKVAKICHAFDMKILVYDPYLTKDMVEDYVTLLSLDELLASSDIVSVHCKDVKETERMINADSFKKMKKTAYFVNTARGIVVDEKALIEALRNKEIAGAAIDVYESEPIAIDHPFLKELNNVVTTPHLAGATYDAISNHTRQVVEDVISFIENKPLKYEYKF